MEKLSIKEQVQSIIDSIKNMAAASIAEANEQRKELIALHGRMADTRNDLAEISEATGEVVAAFAEVEELSSEVVDKIDDALMSYDDIPDCDYENFVGYCETCGELITKDDYYDYDEDGDLICSECIDEQSRGDEDDEEIEVEDGEDDSDVIDLDTEDAEDAVDESKVDPDADDAEKPVTE